MKLILKKNGNLFLWVVLPLLFLISAVAGVSLVSKDVESRIGSACYFSAELLTCRTGESQAACQQRVGDEFCDADRRAMAPSTLTIPCRHQRCQITNTNGRCVDAGEDTTSPGCMYIPGCPNGIQDPGEQCDSLDDIGQCSSFGPGFHCRTCRCVTQCGDGIRAGGEQCDTDARGRPILGPECGPRDTCTRNCKCFTPPPVCGDGVAEGTEQCDGADTSRCPVPGSTCSGCACVPPPRCGDGRVDVSIGDQCDVGSGRDSASIEAGNAQCLARSAAAGGGLGTICNLDTCTCGFPPPACGDNALNGSEQCEVVGGRTIFDPSCAAGSTCSGCRCIAPVCGDGVRAGAEQCDGDASICPILGSTCVGCRCSPPVCGDGIRASTEACEGTDASTCPVAGSTCSGCVCMPPRCGDGVRAGAEQCDGDASVCTVPGSTCVGCRCTPPVCGDGVRAGAEQCDGDASVCTVPGSTCVGCVCTPPVCGDGVRAGAEQCDGDASVCTVPGSTCVGCACVPPPFCGDGRVNGGDQCEVDADCASRGPGLHCAGCICVPQCGDGVRSTSEACEGTDASSCPVAGSHCERCNCIAPQCGNSILETAAGEQCDGDPGVCPVPGSRCDGCRCIAPVCGNGVREGSEVCDGADRGTCTGTGSRCESCQCVTPTCGNGHLDSGEECDRADPTCNTNAFCIARYGNPRATYNPDLCKCVVPNPVCNDGIPDTGEECDGSADICPTSGSTCRDCRCIPPVKQPQAICGDGRVNQDAETCDSLAGTTDVRIHPENPMGYNLLGACRADCTYCGDGIKNGPEECDPRTSSLSIPAGQYCDNNCKLQPISVTPATSPSCGDGSVNSGEACDVVAGSPLGCLINPENHRPEADCVNCTCVPWIIEGGGGSGGTFKCSFDPSASFNISSFLIQLALISFLPLGAMWRLRRKK